MIELVDAFDRLGRPRLLVIGDVILDRYSWGNAERVSPEAPVVVLKVDRREVRLGGAASVAGLLRGLDVNVSLIGIVGNDSGGRTTAKLLVEEGINASGVLVVDDRPTTTKERMIGRAAQRHPFQILRVDEEVTDHVKQDIEDQLLAAIDRELPFVKAVLVSDYAKGVCTPRLLRTLIERCLAGRIPVIIDPGRGVDCSQYRGATLLKPNRLEAALATGMTIDTPIDAMQAAIRLAQSFDIQSIVITLDCDGMVIATADGGTEHVPTKPRQVYDITGAGDMALAVLGLGVASDIPLPLTVRLANVASSLEVQRHGVTPICRNELREALVSEASSTGHKQITLSEAAHLADRYRCEGRRIVLTNGCFDLLHSGHVKCLQQAASFGDVLFVAINSDTSVRRLKGPNRPIYSETDRAQLLTALECVNHVLVFDGDTPHHILERIRPDVLVKGGTYRDDEVVGRDIVLGYGGQVSVTGSIPGRSTTSIISQCQLSDVSWTTPSQMHESDVSESVNAPMPFR